jgi:hypothetical protein
VLQRCDVALLLLVVVVLVVVDLGRHAPVGRFAVRLFVTRGSLLLSWSAAATATAAAAVRGGCGRGVLLVAVLRAPPPQI